MYLNSTTENLILYYFNETDLSDTVLTQHEIDTNAEVEEEYQSIVTTMDLIDQSLLSPSSNVVDKILQYSKMI
jgi:hypothetical protein